MKFSSETNSDNNRMCRPSSHSMPMKTYSMQTSVCQLRRRSVLSALFLGVALLLPGRMLANTTENQSTTDASGSSSLTGTANWTPSTTVAPTNLLATTYDYISALTLRTPQNQNSYTIYADSLTLNSGGSMGFKGSNVITIPNFILNGGKIANSATSGNPDMARLAGNINLTASSSLSPNGAGTFINMLATITNNGSSTPTLTLGAAGTVILSAQNTFTGNITVNNVASGAILQLGTNSAVPATAVIQLNGGANGAPIFDLHGFNTTIAGLNPTSGTLIGFATNTAVSTTSTLTISNNASFTVNNGIIADNPATAGTVALAITGSGTVTLNTANPYHGSTTISGGTLALGSSGSINNSPSISIASGATFDVSQISSYTLGSGTTLSASGSSGNPATINGAGGGSVSLGAQLITLIFAPTTFTGDVSHPSLLISQGDLTLNNNSFTVNNASGTPLGAGTYELIQVNDGNINQNASPACALTMTGSGLAANTTGSIQVGGGSVNLVVTFNGNPAPAFANLTASQPVAYGTASVTLSGTVHYDSTYPTNGEAITVDIDGNAQATTINDNTGDFSISYNLSGIPASASPYAITYSYNGDALLGPAVNTSTTLTVQKATSVITAVTPSQTVSLGTAAITLGGTVSAGLVYPPAGETVSVTIDGNQQNTTISDTMGDFTISYNSANLPGGAWTVTYAYAGDASFSNTQNISTTLTVETNTVTENQTSTDAINTSSLTATNNWTPATTVVPTSPAATNYDFITALTLRTPPGAGACQVYADSLTINNLGSMGFKGYGLVTIPNLILNGGKIANSGTGGNPDEGQLAGAINLAASSTLTLDNAVTSMINIFSDITNAAGISPAPVLTCSGGGTIILSAQNTFNGSIIVAGDSVSTILQLGTNNALPVLTGVTLDGATGVNGPGVLDLNGFSETLSNLTFSSTSPNYGYVTNSATGTTGILTLGYGDTTETLQYGTIADDPGVGGTLALTKIGAGTLTLAINTAYSGNTTISAGTLALGSSGDIPNSAEISIATNATFDVSQTSFTLGTSQILGGGGTVNGSLQANGTISPSGTLTVNGDLMVNGNLTFTVNTSQAQSNDVMAVSGALNNTGTGTLTVSNLGPSLAVGDTFTLFNQPLNNGGSLTIVPPTGVVFTNNLSLNGTLTVLSVPVSQPAITGIRLVGTNLIISGTNGLAGEQYNVLTSTNVALPLSQWTTLPTNTFGGGNFSITNLVSPNAPHNFYILRVP